jgi:UDP-3-O-[3-hydroxymyristoyl] glucosamine N-acyltransferase
MPSFTVAELAEQVSGTVEGDSGRRIEGLASVSRAGFSDLTFVTAEKYRRLLEGVSPGAALVPVDMAIERGEVTLIRVEDPQLALSRLTGLFFPDPEVGASIAATAQIGRRVTLGERVAIGPWNVGLRTAARWAKRSGSVIACGCTRACAWAPMGSDMRRAPRAS